MMNIKESAKLINEYLSLEHQMQTSNEYIEGLMEKAVEQGKNESWTTEQIYGAVINRVVLPAVN